MPATDDITISLSNIISIPALPEDLRDRLAQSLTIPNPKWQENDRMGRWNKDVPRTLSFYDEPESGGMTLPRGYIRQLINTCKQMNLTFRLEDKRRFLPEVEFQFSGRLKPFQQEAADQMLAKEFGTLNAPTGAGKTVMALYMIARRKQPALIVVHTRELAEQWIQRAETFLGIPAEEIGMIGAGKNRIGSRLTLAMVQSLYKRSAETAQKIGYVIVDECHRTPSRTFNEAITAFDARYMTGLSATPWRRDGLSKLIFWHLGDLIHQVDKSNLEQQGDILKAEVVFRETEFSSPLDASQYYTKVLSQLVEDKERNTLIASDVAKELASCEGICLVLSDRKAHCDTLKSFLKYNHRIEAELLTGDLSLKERREVMERINQNQVKVLVATGQLIGEGFDCNQLSTLFLATPIKFSGRLLQYLGRVLRPAPGKEKARVFDYVDVNIGVLEAAARSRQRVYETE